MKKLLCTIICICLLAPSMGALAQSGTTSVSDDTPVVMDYTMPEADAQITAESTIMRVAHMDRLMSKLALQAFFVGEGWESQSEIPDLWAAVYSYINEFELDAHSEWEHTEQGFVRIPAAHIKQIFSDMYGIAVDKLPLVSRSHSAQIVYDDQSDVYDFYGADGETITAALSMVTLGDNNSAVMTYVISQEYEENGETVNSALGTATVYMENTADAMYGLKPVRLALELDSVG